MYCVVLLWERCGQGVGVGVGACVKLGSDITIPAKMFILFLASGKHVRAMNTFKPNFYIVKLGYAGYIYFSYFWSKT